MSDFILQASVRNDLGKVRAAACVVRTNKYRPLYTAVRKVLSLSL